MTLVGLNAMAREDFVATIGWVFEHSPWVAERVWVARPFSSIDALERRGSSSREEEFRTALAQVYKIAKFRIESVLS